MPILFAITAACAVSPEAASYSTSNLQRDLEARANQLWLTRPSHDGYFDRTVVVINVSIGPMIGLSLIGEEYGATDNADSNYLEAAIFEIPEDQPQSDLNIDLVGASILHYQTKVTTGETKAVFDAFSDAGFFELSAESERPRSDPQTYVLDGMGYYVEAQVGGRKNLIVRSSCEIGVGTDIKSADALFDLARQKFPTLSDQLSEMENLALSSAPC